MSNFVFTRCTSLEQICMIDEHSGHQPVQKIEVSGLEAIKQVDALCAATNISACNLEAEGKSLQQELVDVDNELEDIQKLIDLEVSNCLEAVNIFLCDWKQRKLDEVNERVDFEKQKVQRRLETCKKYVEEMNNIVKSTRKQVEESCPARLTAKLGLYVLKHRETLYNSTAWSSCSREKLSLVPPEKDGDYFVFTMKTPELMLLKVPSRNLLPEITQSLSVPSSPLHDLKFEPQTKGKRKRTGKAEKKSKARLSSIPTATPTDDGIGFSVNGCELHLHSM